MKRTLSAAAVLCLVVPFAAADVRVPSVLSDYMVLQRRSEASLWGWARPGEEILASGSWGEARVATKADDKGRWRVALPTPDAGGPHTVTIKGDNTVVLSNVMVGEVWVCSGQSNMEWNLAGIGPGREGVPSAEEEIKNARFPTIRLFTVPNTIAAEARTDCEGKWSACTPETAKEFSAVGYFFARELVKELNVPVGLISSDWGGTPAESWTSERGLKGFPEFKPAVDQLAMLRDPNTRGLGTSGRMDDWWKAADAAGGGAGPEWAALGFDDSAWKILQLPAGFRGEGVDNVDGIFYVRLAIDLPPDWAGQASTLELGPIDDRDQTLINGVVVGATSEDGKWSTPRRYQVPTGVLRAGKNVIAVRVLDTGGLAGINGTPEQMKLSRSGAAPVSLAADWKFAVGADRGALAALPESQTLTPHTPTSLYNGMIAPITGMTVRGAIWYQGESNVGRAAQYTRLFPAMIQDWRTSWGLPEMSFLFVQIAPFAYGNDTGQTAELREAQTRALALPHTGMVCTLDLGNPRDIHPDNKQEVGRRLALNALAGTYGKKVIARGPVYASAAAEGGKVKLAFDFGGAPLELSVHSSVVSGFVIAGEDRRFFPAQAEIAGANLFVSSPNVAKPIAARYAWSAAPEASVFGATGLPLEPFRTDAWPSDSVKFQDAGRTGYLTDDPAFTPIFNGKDLTGWHRVNCDARTFAVKDGAIVCTGVPTGLLRSEKQYENYVLELEWKHHSAQGNAGLFIWSDALTARGQPFSRAIEVQVMVGAEGDWYTSDGDIFPIHGARMTPENGRTGDRAFPTEKRMKPAGEWNHYRVECIDGAVSLAVNGKVVTRGKACMPRKGYIMLESEGTPIEFRNLRIKELPPSSPTIDPKDVAGVAEGFVPLYGGVDFSGWKFGPEHEGHWKAEDWTITFDGEGADLWTEKSYKDFVLIADWRWTAEPKHNELPVILPSGLQATNDDGKPATKSVPEAGDSGIYLRGSSKSQVNIWCWPCGSGEVYGYRTDESMPPEVRAGVTPKENADAPIGKWNRFVITMKGDRLTVVLNGKAVIENAQLLGVATEGPIAMQMHHSPIQFANVMIRELR